MSRKSYSSVLEMVRATSDDEEGVKLLEERIRRTKLVTKLMAIRASKGLTQADIARGMKCSQGRVSKFEASDDDDLRLGDLRSYLNSLNLELGLQLAPEQWTVADQIKFHAFQIRDCLDRLVELAKHDKHIRKTVQQFHVETLDDLVKLIAESAQNLPKLPVESPDFVDADSASRNPEHAVHTPSALTESAQRQRRQHSAPTDAG